MCSISVSTGGLALDGVSEAPHGRHGGWVQIPLLYDSISAVPSNSVCNLAWDTRPILIAALFQT